MSKNERTQDGFYSKVMIAAVVVIWVSLVGGNWLGTYIVEKKLLGNSEKQTTPATTKQQRPKPWITVDPAQQQELERLQGGNSSGFFNNKKPSSSPSASTATPSVSESPLVTASPIEEAPRNTPAPALTPVASPSATPGAPSPTPASVSGGDTTYTLQFGSFASEENAKSYVDTLSSVGQEAQVEEFETNNGKKAFRVRGGSYTEEQARQQRDKLREQNIQAFIVNAQ